MKILLSILIASMGFLFYEGITIWARLDTPNPEIGSFRILDRSGKIIADLPLRSGYSRAYSGDFTNKLVRTIVSVEDQRFFFHHGVDVIGKVGAIRDNFRAGGIVRGGSTLTEQYIKNRFFAREKRTLSQKLKEAYWAIIIEIKYSKEDILRKYLETVYMGNGIYGIEGATISYFGKASVDELSDEEIGEIITRIKYPNLGERSHSYGQSILDRYDLTGGEDGFPERQKYEYTNALPFLTTRIQNERKLYCSGQANRLESFLVSIPTTLCDENNLELTTSIDLEMTLSVMKNLESIIGSLEGKNVHNASVLVWSESTKKILIYIGNRRDGRENAIDMIARKRSVGSILKPFVYLLAFEKGYSPNTLIMDDTRIYETEQKDQVYLPQNYVPKAYGPISLGEALGNSLNSATVRLTEYLGIGRIYDLYRSVGFRLDREASSYGYGISLGTVELSLEDVVFGYRFLTDISQAEKFLLYHTLLDEKNRGKTFGISSILNTSLPLAVKTGTSTDFKDNWVVGYSPDIVIGIWVGNTSAESMDDVSGVTGAGPLYNIVAETLIAKGWIRPLDPVIPAGIVSDFLCEDIRCFQKSATYLRKGGSYKSRPKSGIYFKEDFIGVITAEEEKKWKIR